MNLTEKLNKENLTEEQLRAVRCINRDLEIIACAGAGKTKTVTLRIVNLIASGVDPKNIVAITFTRKAATELKSRIYAQGEKLLGGTVGFADMFIGTIDAFCLNMLQDYVPEYAKYSVLDEVQARVFIERKSMGTDVTGFKDSVIDTADNLNFSYDRATYSRYHDEKYDKKLKLYIDLVALLNQSWFSVEHRDNWDGRLKGYVTKYNSSLSEEKYFDFSGVIKKMIELLDPESDINQGEMDPVAAKIYERVKYLTIDEYQDCNPSQEKLVELFKKYGKEYGGETNVCVVGDADQTIYQFRGSDEKNIIEFADKYSAERFYLNYDFRSTEAVIDIANAVIGNNHIGDKTYKKMERGKRPGYALEYEPGDTVWKSFTDYAGEADFIVARIKELSGLGIPYSEMAVLLRQRDYLYFGKPLVEYQMILAEKLKAEGIPYEVEGMNALYKTPEYKAFAALFRYIKYRYFVAKSIPTEDGTKSKTIYRFKRKDELERDDEAYNETKACWLEIDNFYGCEGLTDGIDEALKFIEDMDWSSMKFGSDFNIQGIYQEFIGYLNVINMEDEKAAEQVLYNLGMTSRVISDFEKMFFTDMATVKLTKFVDHINKVADGLYARGEDDNSYIRSDAVRIMTIHQSKGLEFTAVFIPAMVKEIYDRDDYDRKGKIYGAVDAIENLAGAGVADWLPNYEVFGNRTEDVRKLVYVAITRAKKYLFMTYSETYGGLSQIPVVFFDEAKKSRYLQEYSDAHTYTAEHLPEMNSDPLPIVLNFSLLSNYYDCPYRFKLSNFYGFVQPYKDVQGYGKVLHEIMMHIHRAWIEGRRPNKAEIDRIAEEALFLPYANSAQLDKSLKGAKKCAEAYVKQNEANADKVIASEMNINLEMGQGVSVNGRIDLVKSVDTAGLEKVSIVDLKSAGKDAEQCLNAEQLKIYALGYENATGKKADYLEIYNLDHPDGSKNAREEVKQEVLESVRKGVIDAANNIRNNNLPKCRSEKCATCYVKGLCGK